MHTWYNFPVNRSTWRVDQDLWIYIPHPLHISTGEPRQRCFLHSRLGSHNSDNSYAVAGLNKWRQFPQSLWRIRTRCPLALDGVCSNRASIRILHAARTIQIIAAPELYENCRRGIIWILRRTKRSNPHTNSTARDQYFSISTYLTHSHILPSCH